MYKLGGYKINSDNFWSSRVRGGGFSKLSYYPKSIKNEGCFPLNPRLQSLTVNEHFIAQGDELHDL